MSANSQNVWSRRSLLKGGLAAAAVGATGAWFPSGAFAATPPFVAYTPNSFFRSPVAGAPSAAARTAAFRTYMNNNAEQKGVAYPQINGISDAWGTAFALGVTSDPVWKLTGNVPAACADLKTVGFHAPSWFGSMLTGTSDSPFVCIDTATGQSIWAAQTRVTATRTINVGAAGRFMHNTNGLDRRNPLSNGPKNERSRGAIPDGMVIRRDLLDHAIANNTGLGHVLHMFLVETKSSDGFCHPMTGTESPRNGFGAEGERIAISPTVNLTTRGMTPGGLAIARTLQQHGCYFGDNSGSKTALKAEQNSSTRNPWLGSGLNQHSLKGITWNDFVVLPKGWQ